MNNQSEVEPSAPAYVPVVRDYSHGFYGGTRRANSKRATEVCRHMHETREAAEACADKLTALRNEVVR